MQVLTSTNRSLQVHVTGYWVQRWKDTHHGLPARCFTVWAIEPTTIWTLFIFIYRECCIQMSYQSINCIYLEQVNCKTYQWNHG